MAFKDGEAYTLDDLKRVHGLGEWALKKLRKQGLKVRRLGRRSFVLGKDLIDCIENNGQIVS